MAMALGATFGQRIEVYGNHSGIRDQEKLRKRDVRVAMLHGKQEMTASISTSVSRLREEAGRVLAGIVSFFNDDLPEVGDPVVMSATPKREVPKLEPIPAGAIFVNGAVSGQSALNEAGQQILREFGLEDKALESTSDQEGSLREKATEIVSDVMKMARETGEAIQEVLQSLALREAVAATVGALILLHPSTGGTESHIVNRGGIERPLPSGDFGPRGTMDAEAFHTLIGKK